MSDQIVKCGAVKHGGVTLRCGEPDGHAKDGSWHKAMFTEHRELVYDGAHHVIDTVETVTWEPVDYIREAVRHMMTGRSEAPDDPGD